MEVKKRVPVKPGGVFVSELKQRLEKLEKEKNVTNYEKERGVSLIRNDKSDIVEVLEVQRPSSRIIVSSDRRLPGSCITSGSDLQKSEDFIVEARISNKQKEDSSLIPPTLEVPARGVMSERNSSVKRKPAFRERLVVSEHCKSLLGFESNLNSATTALSNDSGVYGSSLISSVLLEDGEDTPPPLPGAPPPPKPVRTFMYDPPQGYENSGFFPFISDEFYEFCYGTSSCQDLQYDDIIVESNPNRLSLHPTLDEETSSDWSGSVESVPTGAVVNAGDYVELRRKYLEMTKSYATLDRKPSVYIRPSRLEELEPEADDALCETAFLLGLTSKNSELSAEVIIKVPENANIDEGIRTMCFPDVQNWTLTDNLQGYYTIILTSENGDTRYAHCHRVRIEGFDTPIPFSYCVISKHRCTAFFEEVLREVAKCHGLPLDERKDLLNKLCASTLPKPGETFKLPSRNREFKRTQDWRLSEVGLDYLFDKLGWNVKLILDLFSTVLHERKVVLVGRSISEVSYVVQGLINTIYPLVWQYNLVSILPASLSAMTESPIPYIMGLLVSDENIQAPDEGMIINIDAGTVLHACGDEGAILPRSVRKVLHSKLKAIKHIMKSGDPASKMALLAEAFLGCLFVLLGDYRYNLVLSEDGTIKFNQQAFIDSHAQADCHGFLSWFVDTTMFQTFIQEQSRLLLGGQQSEGPLERKRLLKTVEVKNHQVPKNPMRKKFDKFAGRLKKKFPGI